MTTTVAAHPGLSTGISGFKTEVKVQLTGGLWVLLEPLVWEGSDGDVLIVPAGEETDFASVPQFAQFLLPSADVRVVRAAIVHDFLCRELGDYYHARRAIWDADPDATWEDTEDMVKKPAFSPVDADAIFKKIMADEGAGWWMQNTGWLGVRFGAAANPARRPGWLSTLLGVAGLSTVFLGAALVILSLVVTLAILVGPW